MFAPAAGTAGAYGLGYGFSRPIEGQRVLMHTGGNYGWKSEFAAVPNAGGGIVVLANGDTGLDLFFEVRDIWRSWVAESE